MTDETVKILIDLAGIERGLARIYRHFSNLEHFSGPVRKFWTHLAQEEDKHAEIFESLGREKRDGRVDLEISADFGFLKSFVGQVNQLIKTISQKKLSEEEAYSLGAKIEAELKEASFLKGVRTKEERVLKTLQKIDLDTKKHGMLLMSHSKGHV